jgi:uncharacterized DUF497 family protein
LNEGGVFSRLRYRINVHTINAVEITYDAAKNARNVEERGLSFEQVQAFDFQSALFVVDDRKEYGEVRYRGLGLVGERVHALVFTETPKGIRVISFRKANRREVKSYEQAQEQRST